MKLLATGTLAVLTLAGSALADEIRLKDGTKIIGTIVGFEDNSFRVETNYGFALVRKDKIAAIIPTEANLEPKKEAAAETTRPPAAGVETPVRAPAPTPKRQASPAVTGTEPPATPSPPRALALEKGPLHPPVVLRKANRRATQVSMPPSIPPAASQNVAFATGRSASAAPLVARPPAPPEPPPISDEVQGNTYINHTYGFRMFKPPSWQVIEGAQTVVPSTIVAMGTDDETTLFIVGREPLKVSLETQAAATERRLREIYENYRRVSENHTRVAGQPALASRYRGTLEGHDWSGVVLCFARGKDVFIVLGMTYADSDLIQIQENVIAKTIASLQFTAP